MKILTSIRAARKLAKMARIKYFRNLDVNPRLVIIQGAFIQEKKQNFGKKSELCSLLTVLFQSDHYQL